MSEVFPDFTVGLKRSKLWLYLGWSDIKQRYRGSMLGPLWLTFNMAFFVLALGMVYSRLFKQNIQELIPFLTASLIAWNYLTGIVVDSCDVFMAEKDLIENFKLPYHIYIFKLIWRNMLIMGHNFIVYLAVCLFFLVNPHIWVLLFVPGFIITTIGMIGLSMFLGMLGVRYRDIPPIINSLIVVAFLVSPITWKPEMLANSLIVKLNPISYYMDILRSPLLGHAPTLESYLICTVVSLAFLAVAGMVFKRYGNRISFWV